MYEQLGQHMAQRFTVGGGMLSPDRSYVMINIPKNASSFTGTWLNENGWTFIDFTHHGELISTVKTVGVILRDPIQRFCTGFTQYFVSYIVSPPWHDNNIPLNIEDVEKYWPVIERLMTDVGILFDDHTMPQYYFYESFLPNVDREYFYCNDALEQTLLKHFKLNTATTKAEQDANITAVKTDPMPRHVSKLVKQSVEKPHIKNRLMQMLQKDYQKINSTQFIRYK